MRESSLVAFYRGDGRDHRGRLLSHIHQYSFDDLERHHDYIQWLFPLPEPSGANPWAPLLTEEDAAAFQGDESLRASLLRSFQLMLQFYGLELEAGADHVEIRRAAGFDDRRRIWLTPGNHNFLRLTRILRSLSLLGEGRHAAALLKCLDAIYADEARIIGTTTMGYWRGAVVWQG
jgi:hypothetical protein